MLCFLVLCYVVVLCCFNVLLYCVSYVLLHVTQRQISSAPQRGTRRGMRRRTTMMRASMQAPGTIPLQPLPRVLSADHPPRPLLPTPSRSHRRLPARKKVPSIQRPAKKDRSGKKKRKRRRRRWRKKKGVVKKRRKMKAGAG